MGCCTDCAVSVLKKILMIIISLLKVFVAIAIIVVLAKKLTKVDVAVKLPDSTNPDLSKMVNATLECLLTKEDWDGNNLCAYTYVVAAASIIISGLISLFLCCTCNLCGLGGLVEVLLAVAGTCWWVACAIILGKYGKEANDAKTPHEDARNTVIVLSWIEVGLFGLTVLIALITAVNCLRKCLCCCCKDDSDDKSRV